MSDFKKVAALLVEAEVRYWEDAIINGAEDEDGSLVPFRDGNLWKPVIDLKDGKIHDWPEGTTAHIHYKVCDQGEYWLIDSDGNRLFKWDGYYVPDDFLCHGDQGFGDYIIFHVDANGMIRGWQEPKIIKAQWDACD